jgi:pimeloyl-ACP methyl ester carboxylesterase
MSDRMRQITGDGVELAARVEGEGDGPAVLLLHGFPDSSRLWRHQIPALTGAGLRTIAPDLRGFGDSDKPEGVKQYAISRSVADMVAVLDELQVERAHVVGHDFGAVVAWAFAAYLPERVDRLVAMSVGHPATGAIRSIQDREMAWYQLLFQFEGLAEELAVRDDWRLLRDLFRDDGDIDQSVADLSRPGALTAALSWYRANLDPRFELTPRQPVPPVAAPTLGLWSSEDHYLAEHRMIRSAEHVTGPWRYERIDRASHWMQLDRPDLVNALLLEFLAG